MNFSKYSHKITLFPTFADKKATSILSTIRVLT